MKSDDYTIRGWHIHVYYGSDSKERAQRLRDKVAGEFDKVALGRWHDEPVGPHPEGSYQIAFGAKSFATLVPFVARHREGLTVLLHGLSGDDLRDHTDLAMWMGASRQLRLDMFKDTPET